MSECMCGEWVREGWASERVSEKGSEEMIE